MHSDGISITSFGPVVMNSHGSQVTSYISAVSLVMLGYCMICWILDQDVTYGKFGQYRGSSFENNGKFDHTNSCGQLVSISGHHNCSSH